MNSPEGLCLAIVGWRQFTDQSLFDEVLAEFVCTYGMPVRVISGGARGADTLAERWARKHRIKLIILKPAWRNARGQYNRRAGLERNSDIVAGCTHLVAFPSENGSGTQDSIGKARERGKVVVVKWV